MSALSTDASELKDAIANDAQGAITDFLAKLKEVDKADRMGILVDLFGLENADDMAVLVGGLEHYQKALKLTAKESQYLGSMEREFQNQMSKKANQLKMLANKASNAAIQFGGVLWPSINKGVAALSWLADKAALAQEKFPGLTSGITLMVGGLLGAVTAFKLASAAGKFFGGGLKQMYHTGRAGALMLKGRKGRRAGSRKGIGGKAKAAAGMAGLAGVIPVRVINWPGGGAMDIGQGSRRRKRRGRKGRGARRGRAASMRPKSISARAANAVRAAKAKAPALAKVRGSWGASGLAKAGASSKGLMAKLTGGLLGKIGLKAVGKGFLKKIPVVGALAGAAFGAQRLLSGDWLGAAGELVSGLASLIPGLGTAASVAVDTALAARDAAGTQPARARAAELAAKGLAAATPPPADGGTLGRAAALATKLPAAGRQTINISVEAKQTNNINGAEATSLAKIFKDKDQEFARLIQEAVAKQFAAEQRRAFGNVSG